MPGGLERTTSCFIPNRAGCQTWRCPITQRSVYRGEVLPTDQDRTTYLRFVEKSRRSRSTDLPTTTNRVMRNTFLPKACAQSIRAQSERNLLSMSLRLRLRFGPFDSSSPALGLAQGRLCGSRALVLRPIRRTASPAPPATPTPMTATATGWRSRTGRTGTLYWYMSPGIVAESDLGGNLKSEYSNRVYTISLT